MNVLRLRLSAAIVALAVPAAVPAQSPGCYATPTSMTPASWRAPARPAQPAPGSGLRLVREVLLPGPANTHYDSVSHCILVTVQTRNQVVVIDPVSERIVQRYDLPGSDHPHGFTIDEPGRFAFVSCEGNAALLVVDLRTMKIVQSLKVAGGPDVLAWDAAWRRLYVAAESGVLSAFWLDGAALRPVGEVRMPHAHTVSVDPRTHLVYLPLENINGKPVLQIYQPVR